MLVTDGPGLWRAPGVSDSFQRSPGPVGGRWRDAVDVWGPGQFDRAVVVEPGVCGVNPATLSTWPAPSSWVVGHSLCSRPMGSLNGEVSIRWNIGGVNTLGFTSQVGPAFGVDLNSVDPLQMGVTFHWDVSLGQVTYAQNAFRSPISQVFDYETYYDVIGSTVAAGLPPLVVHDPAIPDTTSITPARDRIWVTTRVVDGWFSTFWNGVRRHGPTPVPAWAVGRDGWGWHVVSIHRDPGSGNFPNTLIPVTAPAPARWDAWCWRPYNGPL